MEEDRISKLPDAILHNILSRLPSTREAVRCGSISKRFLGQWKWLPIMILIPNDLILFEQDFTNDRQGMSSNGFFSFVANVVAGYESEKILLLFLGYSRWFPQHPDFVSTVRFAVMRKVEQLILRCECLGEEYAFPTLLYVNSTLVDLKVFFCRFPPPKKVQLEKLKSLCLSYCILPDEVIEVLVSGCPNLESLCLNSCSGFERLSVDCPALKSFSFQPQEGCLLSVSCLKLESLTVSGKRFSFVTLSLPALPPNAQWGLLKSLKLSWCSFPDRAIEWVLRRCPALGCLSLTDCKGFKSLSIRSESVKTLSVVPLQSCSISIWCPPLEELKVMGHSGSFVTFAPQAIDQLVSECQSLRTLHLERCNGFSTLCIASTSLTRVYLKSLEIPPGMVEFDCPNSTRIIE